MTQLRSDAEIKISLFSFEQATVVALFVMLLTSSCLSDVIFILPVGNS